MTMGSRRVGQRTIYREVGQPKPVPKSRRIKNNSDDIEQCECGGRKRLVAENVRICSVCQCAWRLMQFDRAPRCKAKHV